MVSVVSWARGRKWYSDSVRALLAESDTDDPVEAIRARAAALITRCELEGPPIDCEMVASFCGVDKVIAIPMKGAGMLVPNGNGGLTIYVNANDPVQRRNFTCDHETTHTLFPNYKNTKKTDAHTGEFAEGVDQEEEYLCDVGAAELRMPSRFFGVLLREAGCSIETLAVLARTFEASHEAAAVQMVNTGIHACGIIIWHPANKPTEEKFMDQAQGLFDGMEDFAGRPLKLRTKFAMTHGIPHFFPRHKSVMNGCPIHECYLSGETRKGKAPLFVNNTWVEFHTESMYIPVVSTDGARDGKVVTIVFPHNS